MVWTKILVIGWDVFLLIRCFVVFTTGSCFQDVSWTCPLLELSNCHAGPGACVISCLDSSVVYHVSLLSTQQPLCSYFLTPNPGHITFSSQKALVADSEMACRQGRLPQSLMTWVPSPRPEWWNERATSHKWSPDFHLSTMACTPSSSTYPKQNQIKSNRSKGSSCSLCHPK